MTSQPPNKSRLELPEDRPATIAKTGERITLYPAEVRGFFRRWRTVTQTLLVFVFLALPWLKIGGHQAVLLDLPGRHFAFFGLTFWAHDTPLLFFVLGALAFGLALITALFGRIWCGWACPQTVFIDGLFRRIELWTEGSHLERRKRDSEPLTAGGFLRKTIKWLLFLAVSLVITHSFLAYFVGADRLLEMVQLAPAQNWTNFVIILVTTGLVLFDFGWFREQFCIIACPYGRFQSVLMDNRSLNVIYDYRRGEPRKGAVPDGQTAGDCVNCFRCVAVCPTGVDIRRGTQLECIGCTACIDACDEIMAKVGKPKGLIRYDTEKAIEEATPVQGLRISWRPRVFIYLGAVALMVFGLIFSVGRRQSFHAQLVREVDSPYRIVPGTEGGPEKVTNHFRLHFQNQSSEELKVQIVPSEAARQQGIEVVGPQANFSLGPGLSQQAHFFLTFPKSLTAGAGTGKATATVEIQTTTPSGEGSREERAITLIGPL